MPKVELKRVLQLVDESSISTLAALDPRYLFDINQGTAVNNRTGNQIIAKGVSIKGIVHNNGANTNFMRMVLLGHTSLEDVSITGQFFGDANLAGAATTLTGGAAGLNSMYYPINKLKFQVLMDKVIKCGPAGVDSTDTQTFRHFVKLNRKIKFAANQSGSDGQSYRYTLVFWTAEGPDDTALGQTLEVSAHVQAFFTDA